MSSVESPAPTPNEQRIADEQWIAGAYDGSAASFLVLDACGWGALRNLGYYPLLHAPLVLGGLAHFQRRLARESLALLELRPGERVVDAGCGHGWTTAEIARRGASVLGIDLLPDSIAEARRLYGRKPGVTFAAIDATALPEKAEGFALGEGSVDRVHCLESAFHFGPDGRRAFLEEAWRVLRPGGRLVLVDFVWHGDRPQDIAGPDPGRIVRDTWRFEEFEPLARYREHARQIGFRERALLDWSKPVTERFVKVAYLLGYLSKVAPGRAVLRLLFPAVSQIRDDQWPVLRELVDAHERVRKVSGYYAFVLDKPAGQG
jgi:SAM-dependent methyltransferase